MFTQAGCYYCQFSDPAWVRILQEFDNRPLVSLAWHVWWPGQTPAADPYYYGIHTLVPGPFSVIDERVGYYAVNGAPSLIFDGGGPGSGVGLWGYTGTGIDIPFIYDDYKAKAVQQVADTTTVSIALTGDLRSADATVRATITAVDPVTQTNLHYRLVVYEDDIYFLGSNGIQVQTRVVRDVIADEPISLSMGTTDIRTHTFALGPSWDLNALGVVAFVQTDNTVVNSWGNYNGEILQAAGLRFVEPSVLVVRDDDQNPADYEEFFDADLSQTGYNYHMYNTLEAGDVGANDLKATPTAPDLAAHGAVIWSTGSETTNTLNAAERSLIAGYLDNGARSLLVTGENIGEEVYGTGAGQDPVWYRNYLHTERLGNYAQTTIVGVASDPISDQFKAPDSLSIVGTSHDRLLIPVSQQPISSVAFNYGGGTAQAAIRAQHDTNSRVVYMAHNFFEGGDADKEIVMQRILEWLDCAASPATTVTGPSPGTVFAPGEAVPITWNSVDVYVPPWGVSIEYTTNSASPVWTSIASGQPNDGVYTWTAPAVLSDAVRFRITADDGCPTTISIPALGAPDITIADVHDLPLTPTIGLGRLASFRVDLLYSDPATLFADALGEVTRVRWYDPTDALNPWKTWTPSAGGDLTAIDNTMGFWVESSGTVTVSILGAEDPSTDIALHRGWNLVGYPSLTPGYTVQNLKTVTGATRVEGYDATAGPYYLRVLPPTYTLRAGEGYWVYVPNDTVWTVAG